MIADLQLAAWTPRRWKILGVRVGPLLVGHAVLLESLGLLRATTFDQLVLALAVCASRPSRPRFLWSWRFNLWLRARALLGRAAFFAIRWTGGDAAAVRAYGEAFRLWDQFLTHNMPVVPWQARETARSAEDDDLPDRLPALENMRLLVNLMAKLHLTEREALEMPYTRAALYFPLWAETEGAGVIVDDTPEDDPIGRALHAQANAPGFHEAVIAAANGAAQEAAR
jgi:hypothetical protein